MNKEDSPYNNVKLLESETTLKVVVIVTIVATIMLSLVSCIYIYSDKKSNVLENLENESIQLKSLITDNLNYSSNFVDIIGNQVKGKTRDLEYINQLFKIYVQSEDFKFNFGWRKFSWIDPNMMEIVASNKGIVEQPKEIFYFDKESWLVKERVISYRRKKNINDSNLKILRHVYDDNQYEGSVVLSYDIYTLVRNLNINKKHKTTNFIILNENTDVVVQSNIYISGLIDHNSLLSPRLKEALQKFSSQKIKSDFSHIDMINGINYYITAIDNFPFIVVINIENSSIREEIIGDLAKNFMMVCFFASLSLAAIILIYKREKQLRERSEKSSLIAAHSAKAKTNFLAFTAHEIRSPLSFILTGSEIMLKELLGKMPKNYLKYVQGINQKSQEILNFITDILDENQIIEGKFKIQNQLCNVKEMIDDSVQSCLTRFNHRSVEIKQIIPADLPLLMCDKRRISQILNNLISNSIKYSEDDPSITITVKAFKDELVLTVKDEGKGIPKDKLSALFKPYSMHDTKQFYAQNSYGLGLSIVKNLVEAHSATLSVSSEEDKGTIVEITFPKYKLVYDSANIADDESDSNGP